MQSAINVDERRCSVVSISKEVPMNLKLKIIALASVTGLWTTSAFADDSPDGTDTAYIEEQAVTDTVEGRHASTQANPIAVAQRFDEDDTADQQPMVHRPGLRAKDYRRLGAQMAAQDGRYRLGRTLHRVGTVAVVAGVASAFAGSRISGWPENIEWDLGTTLGFTGLALYCVGPALSTAGALHSAGALRRKGLQVDLRFGIVGVSLLGATAALSPLIVSAYAGETESLEAVLVGAYGSLLPAAALIFSWIQVGENRRSIAFIQDVVVLPTFGEDGGGVAFHASF
jgi:hypothetical protein